MIMTFGTEGEEEEGVLDLSSRSRRHVHQIERYPRTDFVAETLIYLPRIFPLITVTVTELGASL